MVERLTPLISLSLICDTDETALLQALQRLPDRCDPAAHDRIGVQLCPGTRLGVDHAQPRQHAVGDGTGACFRWINLWHVVAEGEGQVVFQLQQQPCAPTTAPRLLDGYETRIRPHGLLLAL